MFYKYFQKTVSKLTRSFEKNFVLQEFPCGSCPDPIPSLKLNCKARNFTTISIFHRIVVMEYLLILAANTLNSKKDHPAFSETFVGACL